MHFRPFRSLSALTLASALLVALVPDAGAAGAKDKDAQKLYDQAMNDDYLSTEFAKAEKKLKEAITKCGSDCSPEMIGKIHIALGTVYGVGMSKLDQAKDSFVTALKADGKAALDTSLTTPELTKAFDEAKKAAGTGKADPGEKPAKKATNVLGHTPPSEAMVNVPLPLYFEPPEDQGVAKASVRYKPFGATKYKSAEMRKIGKGFGVEIGCDDVTTTGDIKYYFVLTDESGDPAGTVGSQNDPFKAPIKNEIEGEAPRLPGKKAPDQCKDKTCPPGLPGCAPVSGGPGDKRGDKGWGASCEATSECKAGFACLNGSCEEGKDDGTSKGDASKWKGKPNMIGLTGSLDMLIISGAAEVCSGNNTYACFLQDTNHQYFGKPVKVGQTNGIQGGFGVGGGRINLQYDRMLLKTLGLSLGARVGFALGGSPSPDNAPTAASNPNIGLAKSFLPVHLEARASWHFGGSMFEAKKFHPYVYLGGGSAQVNASVPVSVCDSAPGATGNDCGNKTGKARNVDAYQVTGLGFITVGGGSTFAITQNFGVMAELKLMFMIPTFGFVLSPTIGPVVGF